MRLQGRTVLITGGATGIGFELARQLQARGNTVLICGRRETALHEAQQAVPALLARRADIADAHDRADLVRWIGTEHRTLDVLIHNAGVQMAQDFASGTPDPAAIEREIAINFAAPVLLTAALLPLLRRQPESAIVNVSSGLAFCPLAEVPIYCATKAAVHSFTLSLRHQLLASHVRVLEIIPPIVRTELGGGFEEHAGGPPVLTPEEFVSQALLQLENGQQEAVVGLASSIRAQGERLFETINR